MSRERRTSPQSHVTTDPDTIRAWGEEHGMVPVRYEYEGEPRLDLVPEPEVREEQEPLSWDEFSAEMGQTNQIAVRHGDEDPDMEVIDRSDMLGRTTAESDEVEDALLSGETVETRLSERKVVEHTVVEEATVRSEIVDREILQTDTVDVRLLTSDVDHCTVSRAHEPEESADAVSRFEPGARYDEAYDVEFEIDEGWTLTRELLERITVESRVVDSDQQDTETVESDTLTERVDLDGVQQTVLQGQLVDSPQTAGEVADTGHVETRYGEDDVIETHLIRRKTVEEEMSVRKQFSGEISDGETLGTDAIAHTVVESEIVGEDEHEADLLDAAGEQPTAGDRTASEPTPTTDADVETAGTDAETTGTGAGTTGANTETTGTGVETTESAEPAEADAGTAGTGVGTAEADVDAAEAEVDTADTDVERTASPVTPTADEEGKTVVDPDGDEIGMVAEVQDRTMYVDPDPSLADQIRSVLGWTDSDENTYPVDDDQVSHIDDDTVVLTDDATQ